MKFNITRDHEWFTGKDWRWRLTMRSHETGEILDITGWSLAWVVKKDGAIASTPALLELGAVDVPVVDGPNGLFDIVGSRELVAAAGIGDIEYAHELRRTDAGEERVCGWGTAFLMQSISG